MIHRKPILNEMLNAMWRYELVFHLRLEAAALKFDILPTAIVSLSIQMCPFSSVPHVHVFLPAISRWFAT